MAEVAYMKIKSDKSGEIKGGCQEKDTKGMIEVQAYEHTITVPTHRQTGAATGETTHGPIVIVKPMDRATPLLQLALSEHHKLDGEIHFYRTRDGKREHWFTVTFTDARLVTMKDYKELALAGGDKPDLEQLELRYRKIKWSHVIQNKESEADWLAK
jgi:type VI secretion system Hcp family effector